jgi:tetratricopeptide (TPR) repeat protein
MSFIPFLLIVLPLAIILVVIVRKFPQITLLDVESLPEVKADKKESEQFKDKVERNASRNQRALLRRVNPVVKKLKNFQFSFRKFVGNLEKKVEKEEVKLAQEKKIRSSQTKLFDSREEKVDVWRDEEKKLLTCITKNPKSIKLYKDLADLYDQNNQIEEAVETYKFVLQLNPDDIVVKRKLDQLLT